MEFLCLKLVQVNFYPQNTSKQ